MNQPLPTTSAPTTADRNSDRQLNGTNDQPVSFWRAWPWWSIPAAAGLALVLYFVDPFIGDWDGIDYTMLSLAGYPSSMALGRNLFIFGNHFLYQIAHAIFHVRPESGYLIFKYAVVAQAPLAIIACWVLARDFAKSTYAATLASLFLVFSPVFVLYGGQVMTDVPSVLLLCVALIIHFRGLQRDSVTLVLIGAGLLGLGVNLRETIGFYWPWLAVAPFVLGWKFRRRQILIVLASCLLFFICALGWFAFWFITDEHYRWIWFGWRESMLQENARHPVTIRNLKPFFAYFFVSAPLVLISLPFALWREWRTRRMSPLLLLGVTGLLADLVLFFNYGLAVNWRYFLTGLPLMAPLCASFLITVLTRVFGSKRWAFVASVGGLLAFAIVFSLMIRPASRLFIERRAMSKEYRYQLEHVPRNAVMISGSQTIAVTYWKAIGLGDWKTIATGSGWPGDQLVPTIEQYFSEGRGVFIDSDPRWWLPCGWQRDEIPAVVDLQKRFSFRKVTETIYELRRRGEAGAVDNPALEKLLPQNRPEDSKKCATVS
ncbi:MAG TPA: glycosyltransferase family 39 protein [Pyrinomonadaceae bacterium]|nr:glycosyltransferase family 39 protein [Pyrinomonadaceae bacterium]